MDEQHFRTASADALLHLQRALECASENHDFDVDSKEGALAIEFEDPPAKFVVLRSALQRPLQVQQCVSRRGPEMLFVHLISLNYCGLRIVSPVRASVIPITTTTVTHATAL